MNLWFSEDILQQLEAQGLIAEVTAEAARRFCNRNPEAFEAFVAGMRTQREAAKLMLGAPRERHKPRRRLPYWEKPRGEWDRYDWEEAETDRCVREGWP